MVQLTTTITPNGFGETATDSATFGAGTIYSNVYTRDSQGRITTKVETVEGLTRTFDYQYDSHGRLEQVDVDGLPTRVYGYDSNGNRVSLDDGGQVTAGNYDSQDRITSYGDLSYAFDLGGGPRQQDKQRSERNDSLYVR